MNTIMNKPQLEYLEYRELIIERKRIEDERMAKYKGMMCTSKPSSMQIVVTLKDLELVKNYFDKS